MESANTPKMNTLGTSVRVHTHACGERGIFVNAYLVETDSGVVAIDSTLTETESKELRREVEALKKPLLAVLITHPHPDHVAGITNLVAGDRVEIVATRPVLELMRRLEEPKRNQWTPVYGSEWVQKWTYPNKIVDSGDRLNFGGVTFSVLDVGPGGDAEQNSVWFVETPQRTAFLSDLVFNGTHSYVADGHLLAWLANLARLERECRGMEVAFPGHGSAGPPARLIRAQLDYLLKLAAHVKELAKGRSVLDDSAKEELERRMTADYPDHGLSFLIGMSADPIARELNGAGS
jgi:glyoxylase-like metal-dependent hydrolase (beta-lactamase superfamily II)